MHYNCSYVTIKSAGLFGPDDYNNSRLHGRCTARCSPIIPSSWPTCIFTEKSYQRTWISASSKMPPGHSPGRGGICSQVPASATQSMAQSVTSQLHIYTGQVSAYFFVGAPRCTENVVWALACYILRRALLCGFRSPSETRD